MLLPFYRILVTFILSLLSSVAFTQVDLSNGLVASYPFSGNADDVCGNGNHGEPKNGVQLTTDRFGNANSAYLFDGVDDYIQISNSSSLNPVDGMSIVLNFNPSKNGVQTLIGKIDYTQPAGTQYQVAMDFTTYPGVLFGVNPPSSNCYGSPLNAAYTNTDAPITLNQWYCVIATFDKGEMKIYLNGSLIESVAAGFSTLGECSNATLQIGSWWTGDLQRFKGIIDDVRIYNRALNTEEVNSLCASAVATPSFTAPDTVCVNTPVPITNTSINATSHFWNFCVADMNKTPEATNLGNVGNLLSQPVFMDFVESNGLWYGFSVNFNQGHLIRHDFGNSLLNTPTAVDLGNFGGIIPVASSAEGIQVVQNEGRWYAIIVGGYPGGNPPRILKIDFGPNITNTNPAATDWGNIGNLNQPIDLHIFKEGNNWYGFTVNSESNSLTRFDFTNSFSNTPTGTNLGNLGAMQYPTGIFAINDNGFWHVFVTNAGANDRIGGPFSLSRIDFGNSLLNSPLAATNLGSLNNVLQHPRDLTIMKSCGQIIGFAVNGHLNDRSLVKLDFHNDLSAAPEAISLGNPGNLSFPHSLSKLFRVNEDIYSFVTNVDNNSLTRLRFVGCTNSSVPSFSGANPPAITYNQPGVYNINLTIDDGLSTQASYCKQVVVLPEADFSVNQDVCDPYVVQFTTSETNPAHISWDFGDGGSGNQDTIMHIFNNFGDYEVQLNHAGACAVRKTVKVVLVNADIIATPDTVLCNGSSARLRTKPSAEFCWYPTDYLDDPHSSAPISHTPQNITYYFTAKVNGVVQQDSVVIITETPSINTGNDTTVCQKSWVPLLVSGASSYKWEPAEGLSNPDIADPVATPMMTTRYIVTGTTQHGCVAKDSILINIHPLPVLTITSDTLICRNNSVLLQASGGVRYEWTPSTDIDYSDIPNPTVTPALSTTYSVKVTDANLCVQEDSVRVAVRPYPAFSASGNQIVCAGSTAPLTASGGDEYSWSPAALVNNPFAGSTNTTPVANGEYSVYIRENACGFDTTINMTIAVNPVPVMTVEKSNDVNCNVPTAQLKASGALAYLWSPADVLDNPRLAGPVASIDTTTLFSVTGNNEFGCRTTAYLTVKADQSGIPRFVVPNAFSPNGDGKNDCFGIKRWGSTNITYFAIYNRWGQLVFESKDPSRCWDGTFNGRLQDAGGYIYVIHAGTICGFVKRQGVLTLVR